MAPNEKTIEENDKVQMANVLPLFEQHDNVHKNSSREIAIQHTKKSSLKIYVECHTSKSLLYLCD